MCLTPAAARRARAIEPGASYQLGRRHAPPVTLGTWNTYGGFEESERLLEYCQTQTGVDVLCVQELRRDLTSWRSRRLIVGGAPPKEDPASGVALILSQSASERVECRGENEGSRIVWVRIRGDPHDLVIIGVYIPHHARSEPSRSETLEEVRALAKALCSKNDCLIIMGDFNSRMARGIQGVTGKYLMHKTADRGGEIMQDMCTDLGLFAASTRFCPGKAPLGSATYMSVKYEKPSQIDYILVSNRWLSGVQDSKVEWRHSLHRWGKGRKFDHGLVKIQFRFRIRKRQIQPSRPEHVSLSKAENLELFEAVLPDPVEGTTVSEEYAHMVRGIHVASETLPNVAPRPISGSKVSENTRELYRLRECEAQGVEHKSDAWREVLHRFRKAIADSTKADKRARIQGIVDCISEAASKHNIKGVFAGLKQIGGSNRKGSSAQPTESKGIKFKSQTELLAAWREFNAEKFSRPPHDAAKGNMRPLRPADLHDEPKDKDLDVCLAALRRSKTCGADGIPAEVYQLSPKARAQLYAIVKRIWREEDVPPEMVEGLFVMLYKNKGSKEDMSKYRAICLLNHGYKLISSYLLFRLLKDVEHALPESQAGFRKRRGCRDNIYILATLIDQVIKAEKSCVVTFIDFSAAFDTVSHFFLDQALEEAEASPKCRAIFREIYSKASARVKLRSPSGETLLSDPFDVRRGVVQGDIFSPLCFILALAIIMKKHLPPGGIASMGGALGALLSSLEYADDAALLDSTPEEASRRVTALAKGAWEDACMLIAVDKSKAMFPRARVKLDAPTQGDYMAAEFGFTCSFCDRGFPTREGLRSHHDLGHCGFKLRAEAMEESTVDFEVEAIIDARGDPAHRWFLVRWKGDWTPDEKHSWQHSKDLLGCSDLQEEFWESSSLDKTERLEQDGEHRCGQCCKFFKRAQDLKTHKSKTKKKGGCQLREGSRVGSLAEKELKRRQQKAVQGALGRVCLGDLDLENVFDFKYLGHLFQADGDGEHAVAVRLAIAKLAFSKLSAVWDAKDLHQDLKLKLYCAGIISVVSYGVEAWDMNEKMRTKLRGWNSRCLHRITGRTYREEAISPTFDLVASVLSRRQKWLGHVLRSEPTFLAWRVLLGEVASHKEQGLEYQHGSLLSEAPRHGSVEELVELAEQRDEWRFWSWLGHWAGKPFKGMEDPDWD